jgi:AcrR family transcriptional regulator
VQAAAQVLAREGYPRATTNRIAEAAGVSIGTLYQYFDSKEAVFDALTDTLLREAVRAVVEHLDDHGATLDARLERMAVAVIAVFARYPGVLRQLDAALGSSFRARLHAAKEQSRARLADTLRRAGVRRAPDLAARVLADTAEGVLFNLTADDDRDALARELVALATRYLADDGRSPAP